MFFLSKIKDCFLFILSLLILLCPKPTYAYSSFLFKGKLDFLNKKFNISAYNSEEKFFVLNVDENLGEGYSGLLKLNHFQTPFFDISSDMKVNIRLFSSKGSSERDIYGKLSSQYSLINYKPINELSGEFEIKSNKISLKSVSFGKVSCSGTIDLKFPYDVKLVFNLSSVEMTSFLAFWTQNKEHDASGLVSGEIKAVGPLNKIFLSGKLTSYDGHVKDLAFNKFLLNIEGNFPEMNIYESSVSQPEGMSFSFEGPINLEKGKDFNKQVKFLKILPLIKDSDSQVEWTLKSAKQRDMGKMELKYLLRKDSDSSLGNEGSDMLGFENIFEF